MADSSEQWDESSEGEESLAKKKIQADSKKAAKGGKEKSSEETDEGQKGKKPRKI
jgi:hypothetical protein